MSESWKALSEEEWPDLPRPDRAGEVEFRRTTAGVGVDYRSASGAALALEAENELAARALEFLDDSPELATLIDEGVTEPWLRIVVFVDGSCHAEFASRSDDAGAEPGTLYGEARQKLVSRLA